jgi:hypothetical protein
MRAVNGLRAKIAAPAGKPSSSSSFVVVLVLEKTVTVAQRAPDSQDARAPWINM